MSKSKRTLWTLVLAVFLAASTLTPAWAGGSDTARGAAVTQPRAWAGWLSALAARWPGLAAWLAPGPSSGSGGSAGLGAVTAPHGVTADPNGDAAPQHGAALDPDGGVTPQHGAALDPNG
jgi:hypothetical protein